MSLALILKPVSLPVGPHHRLCHKQPQGVEVGVLFKASRFGVLASVFTASAGNSGHLHCVSTHRRWN